MKSATFIFYEIYSRITAKMLQLIGEAQNIHEAAEMIKNNPIDVLFL